MSRTKLSVSAFALILSIAGIEHGIGEILQGTMKPASSFIQSWPNNKLYDVLAGEPAFTIMTDIPIYITGIIAVLVSASIMVWVVFLLEKKYAGFIFMGLILCLFLFGGGMAGPVLMGILLCWTSFKMNSEVRFFKKNEPIRKILKPMWRFVFPISILGWFSLWPGLVLLGAAGFVPDTSTVYVLSSIGFGFFLLTIFSALAFDNSE